MYYNAPTETKINIPQITNYSNTDHMNFNSVSPVDLLKKYIEYEIRYLNKYKEYIVKIDDYVKNECKSNFESSKDQIINEYIKYINIEQELNLYAKQCYDSLAILTYLSVNNIMIPAISDINMHVMTIDKAFTLNEYITMNLKSEKNGKMPIKIAWALKTGGNINSCIEHITSTINNIKLILDIYTNDFNKKTNYYNT